LGEGREGQWVLCLSEPRHQRYCRYESSVPFGRMCSMGLLVLLGRGVASGILASWELGGSVDCPAARTGPVALVKESLVGFCADGDV